MEQNSLSKVIVEVPFRSSGNIICNKEVEFEVWKNGDVLKAVPQLDLDQIRIADLPGEFHFTYREGKVHSHNGAYESNLQVMIDIVEALKTAQVV